MTFLPLIIGCVFMVVAVVGAVTLWPPGMKWLFSKIPEKHADAKVTTHDKVMWALMFLTLVLYGEITHRCGTHLWGCFIAGMCFSTNKHSHHVWVRQVKRYTCWFLRIFFACTLAWTIPVDKLFKIEAFAKGTLMGIGPCIATKVLCGPFMGSARWVIGWAMVGRAEFAYFIAIQAKAVNMIPDDLFAILIWSLLYATIFAPLIFRKVLARYMLKQEGAKAEDTESGSVAKAGVLKGRMTISGHLPDLEEEENKAAENVARELSKERLDKIENLETTNAEKDKEVARLSDALAEAQSKLDLYITQVSKPPANDVESVAI